MCWQVDHQIEMVLTNLYCTTVVNSLLAEIYALLYKNFGINVPILTCFVCSQKIPTPHPPVLYSVFGWNWTAQIFFGVCVTPLVLLSINTMKQLVQCPSIPILSNCFPQVCHIVGEGLAEGRFYLRNIRDQTLGETTPYQNFKVSCQTMNI